MICTHCAPLSDGSTADGFIDVWIHDCLYACVSDIFPENSWRWKWQWLIKHTRARRNLEHTIRELTHACIIPTMISIGAWVVAQVPQFIDNYKNESAEALSPWFLAEWLLYVFYSAKAARRGRFEEQVAKRAAIRAAAHAASVNLHEYEELNRSAPPSTSDSGPHASLLTVHSSTVSLDQMDTAWHVHSVPIPGSLSRLSGAEGGRTGDADTASSARERADAVSRQRGIGGQGQLCSTAAFLGLGPGLMLAGAFLAALVVVMVFWMGHEEDTTTSMLDDSIQGMQHSEIPQCPVVQLPDWANKTGLILGYISCTCYLKSRVSQLVKNFSRGDAEGLAAGMFMCAITGNVAGATGILVRLDTMHEFMQQLPWLIGMLGTVGMDVVIASQSWAAAARTHNLQAPTSTQADGEANPSSSRTNDEASPLLESIE